LEFFDNRTIWASTGKRDRIRQEDSRVATYGGIFLIKEDEGGRMEETNEKH
jgi:hypothetical protein